MILKLSSALAFLLALLLSPLTAQIQQAVITYEEAVSFDLPEETDPGIRAMLADMPSQMTSRAKLTFHAGASCYEEIIPEEPESHESSSGNMVIRISAGSNENPEIYYVDLAEGKVVNQRNIFDRQFLIVDELPEPLDWELIPDQQTTDERSGLPVKMATAISVEGDTIQAWYSPSLPVSVGPASYRGLPGAIVKLIDGQRSFQAINIELLSEKPVIEAPTEGKKVSQEKFDTIQAQKMEQMMGRQGPNTRVIRIGG